jgi:hypothetical protein
MPQRDLLSRRRTSASSSSRSICGRSSGTVQNHTPHPFLFPSSLNTVLLCHRHRSRCPPPPLSTDAYNLERRLGRNKTAATSQTIVSVSATPLYCSSSDSFCSLIVMHSPLALLSTARGLEPPSAVFTVSTPNPQVSRGNQSQSGGPVSSDCAEGHHGAAGVLRECVRWGYIIIYVLQHP